MTGGAVPTCPTSGSSSVNASGKLLVSTADACAMLSIGKTSLYAILAANRLASVHLGKKRLILVSSIHELIATLSAVQDLSERAKSASE